MKLGESFRSTLKVCFIIVLFYAFFFAYENFFNDSSPQPSIEEKEGNLDLPAYLDDIRYTFPAISHIASSDEYFDSYEYLPDPVGPGEENNLRLLL